MGFGTISAASQQRVGRPGGSVGSGPGVIPELAGIPHLHRQFRDLLSRFIYEIQCLIIALAVRPWRIRWLDRDRGAFGSILTAYNLGNFLRTLALPEAVEHWLLTTLWA